MLRKIVFLILVTSFLSLVAVRGFASVNSESGVRAVSNFKIEPCLGRWYEIARLPTYFARHCQAPITVEFKRESDEFIVTNSCATVSGEKETNSFVIYLTPENLAGDGKLAGTSLPSWLRWLPLGKLNYWIIYANEEYSLIATPDKKYLWLLARTEAPPLSAVQRILAIAQQQGFDLSGLIFNYPAYYL